MSNEENYIKFKKELESLINRYSIENGSNTPDFMLADYLMECLKNYENITNRKKQWYSTSGIEEITNEIGE